MIPQYYAQDSVPGRGVGQAFFHHNWQHTKRSPLVVSVLKFQFAIIASVHLFHILPRQANQDNCRAFYPFSHALQDIALHLVIIEPGLDLQFLQTLVEPRMVVPALFIFVPRVRDEDVVLICSPNGIPWRSMIYYFPPIAPCPNPPTSDATPLPFLSSSCVCPTPPRYPLRACRRRIRV